MCGRFTLKTPVPELARFFGLAEVPELPPRYNIAPTQPVATVLVLAGDREFRFMRWGMPVILEPEDYDLWLAPSVRDAERLLPLLRQYPAGRMEASPVGTVVNSPAHESPDCVKPLLGPDP